MINKINKKSVYFEPPLSKWKNFNIDIKKLVLFFFISLLLLDNFFPETWVPIFLLK